MLETFTFSWWSVQKIVWGQLSEKDPSLYETIHSEYETSFLPYAAQKLLEKSQREVKILSEDDLDAWKQFRHVVNLSITSIAHSFLEQVKTMMTTAALPYARHSSPIEEGDGMCPVCLEMVQVNDVAQFTCCGNYIHRKCLAEYVLMNHTCCPYCKQVFRGD
jgi:hypothetical protein